MVQFGSSSWFNWINWFFDWIFDEKLWKVDAHRKHTFWVRLQIYLQLYLLIIIVARHWNIEMKAFCFDCLTGNNLSWISTYLSIYWSSERVCLFQRYLMQFVNLFGLLIAKYAKKFVLNSAFLEKFSFLFFFSTFWQCILCHIFKLLTIFFFLILFICLKLQRLLNIWFFFKKKFTEFQCLNINWSSFSKTKRIQFTD